MIRRLVMETRPKYVITSGKFASKIFYGESCRMGEISPKIEIIGDRGVTIIPVPHISMGYHHARVVEILSGSLVL